MTRANWWLALPLGLVLTLGSGCHGPPPEPQAVEFPDGALVRAEDAYWLPSEQPMPYVLRFGTESIPVVCTLVPSSEREPDRYLLRLSAEGQELVEQYAADREAAL